METVEERVTPVVGGSFDLKSDYAGVVQVSTPTSRGTGALLHDGRHILTAAHVLTGDAFKGNYSPNVPAEIRVTFGLPSFVTTLKVPGSAVKILPGWTGNTLGGSDLALIDLQQVAPFGANRYPIYTGDPLHQEFEFYGYGKWGDGNSGGIQSFDRVLQRGGNVWDTGGINLTVPGTDFQVNSSSTLYFDFDNNDVERNILDLVPGVDSAKSPLSNESGYAQGDSGGPNFINKEIAGVTSFSIPSPLNLPFYATKRDSYSKFGDVNGSEWVAKHLTWVDQITTAMHPLVLDMKNQPGGNDGHDDRIQVRRIGNSVQLVVNGIVFHSDPIDRVTSIQLIGSDDAETFEIQDDVDLNTRIDGAGGVSGLVIGNDLGQNRATRIELLNRQANINNQGLLRGIFFSPMSNIQVEGDRLDTIDIRETSAGSPVTTRNMGRVNIGKYNTSDSILAPVNVLNSAEGTDLTIDGIDSGPTRPVIIHQDFVTGIAPVKLTYQRDGLKSLVLNGGYTRKNAFTIEGTPYKSGLSDGGSVRINGGYKSDSFTVNSSSTYLQMNGKAGSDSVQIGRLVKPVALGLPDRSTSEISGPIVVSNMSGLTKLQVIDSTTSGAHNVEQGIIGDLGYIKGMLNSSASISYFVKQTASVAIKTGTGIDTFAILDTASRKGRASAISAVTELFKTTILAGGGNDAAIVSGNAGILAIDLEDGINSLVVKGIDGTLTKVSGSLSVMANEGALDLTVSDSAGTQARDFYVAPSVVSYQMLQTLQFMDLEYRDATSVKVELGKKGSTVYVMDTNAISRTTILGGADSDRIFVRATSGNTLIDAGDGSTDIIEVGSEQNTLDAIRGPIVAQTRSPLGRVVLHDEGSTDEQSRSVEITEAGIQRAGAALVSVGVETPLITYLSGAGNDQVAVLDNPNQRLDLETRSGQDVVTIRTNGRQLHQLNTLRIAAGLGEDELVMDASGDVESRSYTMNWYNELLPTELTTTGTIVNYLDIEHARLELGDRDSLVEVNHLSSVADTTIVGGSGLNTLRGPSQSSRWRLTSSKNGILQTDDAGIGIVSFSGFTDLMSGIGNDVFGLTEGEGWDGSLDGGDGLNFISYQLYTTDVVANLRTNTATDVGSFVRINGLTGGEGNDLLVGGADTQVLYGEVGRDFVVAGNQAAVLSGGLGEDILVAGTTDFDTDLLSMLSILEEWKSPLSYDRRVIAVMRGASAPALNETSAHSNGGSNLLIGDIGNQTPVTDRDLFFALLGSDAFQMLELDEVVVPITI